MRLLAFGSHVTSRNRGPFSKQERKPWERGYFCETCRSDLSSILKVNLILLLLHYKELQTCPLWPQSHLAQKVILLIPYMQKQNFNRRVLLLFARQFKTILYIAYRILPLILMLIACLCGKCAIIYVLCRSPNMTIWWDKNAFTLIMYTLCQMDAASR